MPATREPTPFEREIDAHAREGDLFAPEGARGAVRCFACGHRCLVPDGLRGVCKVRFNRGGRLLVPRGYVAALQCDPIEKKPFFHVLPGTDALSFGMLGCDLHCAYCQNWDISQAGRDGDAGRSPASVTAEELVRAALARGARTITSTYNEPLITAEWAREVFTAAKEEGLVTAFVSNGNATPEVIGYLKPVLDLYKVDLKSLRDASYRKLGGRLEPILDSMERIRAAGLWLEVVTLVIPGFNDSDEELRDIARFLASLGPDVPWHVTAFHRDYRMTENDDTGPATLVRAAGIGRSEGLRFVYAGNLPGRVGDLEDTICPDCGETLVRRRGNRVISDALTGRGACPACGRSIPGLWSPPDGAR